MENINSEKMKSNNPNLEEELTKQLEHKGIEPNWIPLFLKDLIHALSFNDSSDYSEINNRLNILGWDDFKLDYHIFQLAKACFENVNNDRQ
jgi:hypothetical protein